MTVLKENNNMTGYDTLVPAFLFFFCHTDQGIFIIPLSSTKLSKVFLPISPRTQFS